MLERQRGFTTFEFVIVMVVAAILSASVLPTLRYLRSMQADTGASTVVRDLRFAQTLAMTARLRTWVSFDPSSETYSIYIESAPNVGRAGRIRVTDPLLQDPLTRDLRSLFAGHSDLATVSVGGGTEVQFDELGVPYNGSDVALTSSGSIVFESGRVVEIHDETGYVEFAP